MWEEEKRDHRPPECYLVIFGENIVPELVLKIIGNISTFFTTRLSMTVSNP